MRRFLLLLTFSSSLSLIVGCSFHSPLFSIENSHNPVVITAPPVRIVFDASLSKDNRLFILDVLKQTSYEDYKFNSHLNITITDEQVDIIENNSTL